MKQPVTKNIYPGWGIGITCAVKCLNHHHTLSQNIYKPDEVRREIRRIGEYICRKLRSKELIAGYVHLIIRFENLRYAGNEIRLKRHTNDDRENLRRSTKNL